MIRMFFISILALAAPSVWSAGSAARADIPAETSAYDSDPIVSIRDKDGKTFGQFNQQSRDWLSLLLNPDEPIRPWVFLLLPKLCPDHEEWVTVMLTNIMNSRNSKKINPTYRYCANLLLGNRLDFSNRFVSAAMRKIAASPKEEVCKNGWTLRRRSIASVKNAEKT